MVLFKLTLDEFELGSPLAGGRFISVSSSATLILHKVLWKQTKDKPALYNPWISGDNATSCNSSKKATHKLTTVFPHIVSEETILFWIWKSKGHST